LNARWHGLATPLRREPGISREIERLAVEIAGTRFELIDLARRVAEAELELRRVRQARLLLTKFPPQPAYIPKMVESPNSKLFMRAVRVIVRRKKNYSLEHLSRLVYGLGWDPDAPDDILVPQGDITQSWIPAISLNDMRSGLGRGVNSRSGILIELA
jgi:hypothetical protein